MDIVNSNIESFIRMLLPERQGILNQLEEIAEVDGVPIVKPEVAQLLYLLTKLHKPNKVLEIGTAIGYSTLWFAYGMDFTKDDSKIITMEKDPKRYEQAKENVKKSGFEKNIEIMLGDALELLPEVKDSFELLFIDAAKGQYLNFFNLAFPLLKEGGVIITDNVLLKGLVVAEEVDKRYKTMVKRVKEYLEMLKNHPELETVIVPIGDGVAISYKRGEK